MSIPKLNTVPVWYHGYIKMANEPNLTSAIEKQNSSFFRFLKSIPVSKHSYRYAKGKWTIREMLQHIIDCERVFCYRAMCIARKEKQSMPGFDENDYAKYSKAGKRSWKDMVEEFKLLRASTTLQIKSFDRAQLAQKGKCNNLDFSVNTLCFIIIGHVAHHEKILKERYL